MKYREFIQNASLMSLSYIIAQGILFVSMFFLVRIYSPQAIGIWGVFSSFSSIIGTISNGRYDMAIILANDKDEAIKLWILSVLICIFTAAITGIILFVLLAFKINLFKLPVNIHYLIPFSILGTGVYQSSYYFLNREGNFSAMGKGKVIYSGTFSISAIALKLLFSTCYGLIYAMLIAQIISNIFLIGEFPQKMKPLSRIYLKRLPQIAHKYSRFPKNLIFSHGLSAFYMQLPILFISSFYGLRYAGFFSVVNKFLFLPTEVISNAIGDVFRERAAKDFLQKGNFYEILKFTLLRVTALALIPFIILYFTIPQIFNFLLGENWNIVGLFARILIPYAFLSFISTPTDKSAIIVNAFKYIVGWHVLRLLLNTMIIIIVVLRGYNIFYYLVLLNFANGIPFLIDIWFQIRFSRGMTIK